MSRPIWYDSAETGAPTLNNAAGSLLEVLRACLINGFNTQSITSISVASGVATATAATHGYSAAYGKLLRIEGAPVAGLNGDVQPLSVDTNTFTYACPGVSDGTYTGTITARRAPLGWVESHTGTNVAIFASSVVEATPNSLRVDDSGAASMARAVGIPTANITEISSYSGEFPSATQVSGGAYWQKGDNTTVAKNWHVVGDDRGFYIAIQIGTGSAFCVYWFGDGIPFYAADTGFCLLSAQTNTAVNATPAWHLATSATAQGSPGATAIFAPKGVVAGESSPITQAMCGAHSTTGLSGYSSYPDENVYLNPVIHSLVYVISQGPCVRGQQPGLGFVLASAPFTSGSPVVAGTETYLPLNISSSGNAGQIALRLSDWGR